MPQTELPLAVSEEAFADALRMGRAMASKIARSLSEYDELESVSRYAVVVAANRYKDDKDKAFTSYAFLWIRKFLNENARLLRCPVSRPKDVKFIGYTTVDSDELESELEDSQQKQCADDRERSETVNAALAKLAPADVALIRAYYFESMTLAEIGKAEGYSKQCAQQKVKKAAEAFRKALATV